MPVLPVLDVTGLILGYMLNYCPQLAEVESAELRVLVMVLVVGYYESGMDDPESPQFTSPRIFSIYLGQEWGVSIEADDIEQLHNWFSIGPVPDYDSQRIRDFLTASTIYCANMWEQNYEDDCMTKCEELRTVGRARSTRDNRGAEEAREQV